jgi:hypothetical protein
LTDQGKQFADLPGQRAVGFGQTPQIELGPLAEECNEALLGMGPFRAGPLLEQLLLESLGTEGLAAAP